MTSPLSQRCLELGREIFERAHAAEPRVWQRANDWLLEYPRLKARMVARTARTSAHNMAGGCITGSSVRKAIAGGFQELPSAESVLEFTFLIRSSMNV